MPLIPAPGRQRQADLCEFKASLVYSTSSRTGFRTTQRNPVLKNKKEKQASKQIKKKPNKQKKEKEKVDRTEQKKWTEAKGKQKDVLKRTMSPER